MASPFELMAYLLPVLSSNVANYSDQLSLQAPNQLQAQPTSDFSDLQGEIARGRSGFSAPAALGLTSSGALAPSPTGGGYYDTWDALGKMAGIVRQATGGEGGGGAEGIRQERYVHGQPQGQPAKVPDPRQSFNFTTMNNPMESVGMFLLSPEGQRLIKGLQIMGAGNG